MPPEDNQTANDLAANETLLEFAKQLLEIGPVVSDSVFGKRAGIGNAALLPTTDADVSEAFGALRHFAVELRVALSESEAFLATLLLPVPAVAALLGEEIDEETLTEESAAPHITQLEKSTGEFVDLLTLMLFADSPVKGEITVSDVRLDSIEESVGMVLDTAAGAALYRVDFTLELPDDVQAAATLLAPETMLTGLVSKLLGEETASGAGAGGGEAAPADVPAEATAEAASAAASAQALMDQFDDDDDESVLVEPLQFPQMAGDVLTSGPVRPLDLILDVTMRVSVELGRASLTVQEILALGPGSVVELDKLAGEPVDILVNDRLIARGEVVMVDENFGVRVTEIVAPGNAQHSAGAAA